MASPVRRGGPFAPPRTSIARISDTNGNSDTNEDRTGAARQPGGSTLIRGYGSSNRISASGAGGATAAPLAASPLSRPAPHPPGSPKPAASPFAQVSQHAAYPSPRNQPPKHMLSQQLPSPSTRASRSTKIVPENSGTLEYAGSGQLPRLQLPPGSPLVGTPTGSRCGSRTWDALPGVEQSQPQHQLSAPLTLISAQPAPLASPFLGGGPQLESQSGAGYPPSLTPTPPPAPTTPAGIIMIKNNVTLVVHHYVKEPDSDDTDVEEERGSNTSSNCSSDSETQLPAAPPQPSAFLRCMAVICCMAPAKPQRRSRRARRRPSTLMSATEAELAGHVIGPQANAVDFRSKYQKAQAVTPIPVLKRSNSAGNLTPLARTPLIRTPLAASRDGTGGGTAAEPPGTGYSAGYSAGSRFSSYSIPAEGSSPLPRCNSLRSPADVRLSGIGAPSAAGGSGATPPSAADAVGWSFIGVLGAGGGSGTGVAGGSPPGSGLRVAGDSVGLSTISSFSGQLSSGRPSATQAPVLTASGLVQCFQQLGQNRAAAAGAEGGEQGLPPQEQQQRPQQQQQQQQPRRTGTSSTTGAGSSSCRTTSYKRSVRWH